MEHVQSFDSPDEMFAALAANEAAANQRTAPTQHAIDYGDCWARIVDMYGETLAIFGRVTTVDEMLASELLGVTSFQGEQRRADALAEVRRILVDEDFAAQVRAALRGKLNRHVTKAVARKLTDRAQIDDEERVAEFTFTLETTANSYSRGYRFGLAYSVACPAGEYGSTHVSTMIPIDPEHLDIARRHDWQLIDPYGPLHADDERVDLISHLMSTIDRLVAERSQQ